MLSISTVKGAASGPMAKYYTKEYTQGTGEMKQDIQHARERSRWYGDGAEARGLQGPVEHEDLQAVLEGKDPKTGQMMFDPAQNQLNGLQKRLGMERDFTQEDIESLRAGVHPETGEEMPRIEARYCENIFSGRRGLDRSVSAVDMTLSAPKSVSLMVAVGDDEVRKAAEEAHDAAVTKAMDFVKEELVAVRRGHDGVSQEQADDIAAALVTQLASRNHDPQLHTHCVLSTAARGPDGRVSAINAAMIHQASKVIGSVYQQELRHQMTEQLGVAWEVEQNGLGEVKEMPRRVLRDFSTRSAEIDASIDAQHEADQDLIRDVELRLDVYERADMRVKKDPENTTEEDKDRAKKLSQYHRLLKSSYKEGKIDLTRRKLLVQLTRNEKDEPAEQELRQQWQEQWEEKGVSWRGIIDRSRGVRAQEIWNERSKEEQQESFRDRLEEALIRQNATFARKQALTTGFQVADPAWSAQETREQVDEFLAEYAVEVRQDTTKFANWSLGGGAKYTTEKVIQQEKELKEMAGHMLDRDDSAVCDLGVVADKTQEYTLNDEQEELMTSMTVSGQQLVMSRGIAGSGKTHVLGAAASVLRSEDYQVVGLATAAATAQRLSSESGFDRSSSVDRFLQLAENGKWERGTSKELLAEREELQAEKRALSAEYAELSAEAGDDEQELDEIAERRAAAMKEWQVRWDDWLKHAGTEQKQREEMSNQLDARQQVIMQLKQDIEHKQSALQYIEDDGKRGAEEESIKKMRSEVKDAEEKWRADSKRYREAMSPTEDLPEDNKVVLVVDEAGMVETDHYHKLLTLAEERDWKIAFVGDDRQLQEVNRGGAFRLLADMGGSVELGTARRARNEWEQQAQRQWWASEDPEAIREVAQSYVDHDRVTFVTDRVVRTAIAAEKIDPDELDPKQVEREVARQLMVERHFEAYEEGVEHLLIAATREDVHSLNKAVQAELIDRGVIDPNGKKAMASDVRSGRVAGHYTMHKGDSVMVMQNISGTPVKNGMNGEVHKVNDDGSIIAKLPTGPDGAMREHAFPKEKLDEGFVALGNAVTAHKSQGMSVESATALGESSSQREMLYPAMTRGKGDNHVIWLSDNDGTEPEEQLAKGMSRSGRKLTALESWSKGPTLEEISARKDELASLGITKSDGEVQETLAEERRKEYLEHKAQAEERDAKIEAALERLAERKAGVEQAQEQTQQHVQQHAHMHVRERRLG